MKFISEELGATVTWGQVTSTANIVPSYGQTKTATTVPAYPEELTAPVLTESWSSDL